MKNKFLKNGKGILIFLILVYTSNIFSQVTLVVDRDSVTSIVEYKSEDSILILKTINNKEQNIYCDEVNSGFLFSFNKDLLTNRQWVSIKQNPLGYKDLHTNYIVCPLKPGDSVVWQYDMRKIIPKNIEFEFKCEVLFAYLNSGEITKYLLQTGCIEIKYLFQNYPQFEIVVVSNFEK